MIASLDGSEPKSLAEQSRGMALSPRYVGIHDSASKMESLWDAHVSNNAASNSPELSWQRPLQNYGSVMRYRY